MEAWEIEWSFSQYTRIIRLTEYFREKAKGK